MPDKKLTHQKLTKWQDEQIQDAQALLNALDEYSYLKFFLQVIGVFLIGNLLNNLFSLPWIVNLLGVNTIFMTASCFSIRAFFQREISKIITSKSLKDCLFADTQLLHANLESLTDYKMLFLKREASSFKQYLKVLSQEIELLTQDTELKKHQKSAVLHLLYSKLKKIDEQRPYSSYFYHFLTRQPQSALSSTDISNLLKMAIECGDNALILQISSDIKNDDLPLSSIERKHLIEMLKQVGKNNKDLIALFGTTDFISLNSEAAMKPAQEFLLLERCAQISYFINFSLIEPIRDIQQSLQTYHQLGFMLFASGVFLTVPMGLFVGVLALVFVVTQSLELSIRALLSKHSLQEIVDVYAKNSSPHYERLLELKIKRLMTPKAQIDAFTLRHLTLSGMGEVQCLKLYTIILEKHALLRSKKSSLKKPTMDLIVILPLLLRLQTPAQIKMYLDKLRPLGINDERHLLTTLEAEYLIPLRQQISKQEKDLQLHHNKKENIEARWEGFLLNLSSAYQGSLPLEEITQTLQQYWAGQSTDKQIQDLNLPQEQYQQCLDFMQLKDTLRQPQPTIRELLEHKENIEALKVQITLLPKTPADAQSSMQDTYDHLCQMRSIRDRMMSYVVPIDKINSSVLGVLFYFLPMALTISVMAYTVVPAVVFAASVLAVFFSYRYLKASENRDLDKLALADFFGQASGALHLKIMHEKIARLQKNATPQKIQVELTILLSKIEAQPLRVCDRQFLEQIYASLHELVIFKGSPCSYEVFAKLTKRLDKNDALLKQMTVTPSGEMVMGPQIDRDILQADLREIQQLIHSEPDAALSSLGDRLTKLYCLVQKNYPEETTLLEKLTFLKNQWQQRLGIDDTAYSWPPTLLMSRQGKGLDEVNKNQKVIKSPP